MNKIAITALLAATFAAQGCAVTWEKKLGKGQYYPAAAVEAHGKLLLYHSANIGDKLQTTPVHPDDAGMFSGETTTHFQDEAAPSGALGVGVSGTYGTKHLRGRLKVDGSFNTGSQPKTFGGPHDRKQQANDPRGSHNGAFVYTQLIPDSFTVFPSLGIEIYLTENWQASFEAGAPYTGFVVESGHDRFGKLEKVQESSWHGFGIGYGLSVRYDPDAKRIPEFGLYLGQQHFRPEFKGEGASIDSIVIAITVNF